LKAVRRVLSGVLKKKDFRDADINVTIFGSEKGRVLTDENKIFCKPFSCFFPVFIGFRANPGRQRQKK
jgi:hypothetical protein